MSKIDQRTEDAVETVLQQELLRNERVVTHPKFGDVRLKRPNPDQERDIANERRRQFHADMKDSSILCRDELETLAIARGMWSPGMRERIEELTVKTGRAMGILDAIGFRSVEKVLASFEKAQQRAMALFEAAEISEAIDPITRYFNLDLPVDPADRKLLTELATTTEVDDILDEADQLRSQVTILLDMQGIRKELTDLTLKQSKLFADSLESRADRAEELARVYYCSLSLETGKPLWPTFDAMWKAEPEEVTWLIEQMYFFLNGITEEQQEVLGRFGFLQRLSDTSESYGDSPVQPQSKPDGELADSSTSPSSEASA
jgi:hypothetical protein